nr:mitochondrial pyruvate carrier 2-like [Drosophila bipectinata]
MSRRKPVLNASKHSNNKQSKILNIYLLQGLVIAGLSDLARPADSISVSGCAALAATGIIWSRYSLVIIPKNYSLFAVNLFVGCTQVVQLARAYNYKMEQDKLQKEDPKPALTQ